MKSLLQHFGSRRKQTQQELPDEVVEGFLRVLEEVRQEDMPCERVFARLDEYVETQLHGQDPTLLMPLLREHFDLCPECCEEYEALLNVLEKSSKE